jgi:hypothetical protein
MLSTGNNFKMPAGLGLDCAGPGRQLRVHQTAHHSRPTASLPGLVQPTGGNGGTDPLGEGLLAMRRAASTSVSCLES